MRPFFPFYGSKWNTARYYPPPRGRQTMEAHAWRDTMIRRLICAVFHRAHWVYLRRTPEPTCIACLLAGAP